MALLKIINTENGLPLSYHRVVSVNNITNISTIIEVASYFNEQQREIEHNYQLVQMKSQNEEELTSEEQELLNNGINIYIDTNYYSLPYDENMNVEHAYDYLKTLDEYKNAQIV